MPLPGFVAQWVNLKVSWTRLAKAVFLCKPVIPSAASGQPMGTRRGLNIHLQDSGQPCPFQPLPLLRFWKALRFSPATSPGLGHPTPVLTLVTGIWQEVHHCQKNGVVNMAEQHYLGTPVKKVARNSVLPHALTGISWLGVCSLRSTLGNHSCRQPKIEKALSLGTNHHTLPHIYLGTNKKLCCSIYIPQRRPGSELARSSHFFVALPFVWSSPPEHFFW